MSIFRNILNTLNKSLKLPTSKTLSKEFEDLLNMIFKKDFTRDSYSFREMMDWFTNQHNKYPDASKGVVILKKKEDLKETVLYLSLLNNENKLYENNGEFVGQKMIIRKVDEEILKYFGEKEMIILE